MPRQEQAKAVGQGLGPFRDSDSVEDDEGEQAEPLAPEISASVTPICPCGPASAASALLKVPREGNELLGAALAADPELLEAASAIGYESPVFVLIALDPRQSGESELAFADKDGVLDLLAKPQAALHICAGLIA